MVGTGDAKRRMLARVKSDTTYSYLDDIWPRTHDQCSNAGGRHLPFRSSERTSRRRRRRQQSGLGGRASDDVRLCAAVASGRCCVWSRSCLDSGRCHVWSQSRLVVVASCRGRVWSAPISQTDRPTDGAAAKERRALRRKGSFTARELKCESKHTISGRAVHRAQTETERSTGLRGSRTPERTAAVLGQLTGH